MTVNKKQIIMLSHHCLNFNFSFTCISLTIVGLKLQSAKTPEKFIINNTTFSVVRSKFRLLLQLFCVCFVIFRLAYMYIFRAYPSSEFVVANTLAEWKKLEPNEMDFSQGFSQRVVCI